jgi:hypothetical protein
MGNEAQNQEAQRQLTGQQGKNLSYPVLS